MGNNLRPTANIDLSQIDCSTCPWAKATISNKSWIHRWAFVQMVHFNGYFGTLINPLHLKKENYFKLIRFNGEHETERDNFHFAYIQACNVMSSNKTKFNNMLVVWIMYSIKCEPLWPNIEFGCAFAVHSPANNHTNCFENLRNFITFASEHMLIQIKCPEASLLFEVIKMWFQFEQ